MSYIGASPTTTAFVTDSFSGTGSQTAFTMSLAPATTSSIIVAITGVLQDPSTYAVAGTTLTFSVAPPSGTGNISVRYLGIPASGVTTTAYRTITEFTATAGQTSFSVPSYTVGYIDVYRNGVRLGSTDFTATTGTSIVLASGATAGDLVVTESFYVSSVLNAIPAVAGAVNSTYLTSNLTLGGTTNFSTGVTFAANPGGGTQATLNDYEANAWTPTWTFGAGSASVTGSAYYIKIGKTCYVHGYAAFSSVSGASSGSITNLPFTASNISGSPRQVLISREDTATGKLGQLFIGANSTQATLQDYTGANAGTVFANGYTWVFSGVYATSV